MKAPSLQQRCEDADRRRAQERLKADEARAEVARWQAIATRAVEALRGLRKVPLPVEHAEAVSEAIRSFDAANTTDAGCC